MNTPQRVHRRFRPRTYAAPLLTLAALTAVAAGCGSGAGVIPLPTPTPLMPTPTAPTPPPREHFRVVREDGFAGTAEYADDTLTVHNTAETTRLAGLCGEVAFPVAPGLAAVGTFEPGERDAHLGRLGFAAAPSFAAAEQVAFAQVDAISGTGGGNLVAGRSGQGRLLYLKVGDGSAMRLAVSVTSTGVDYLAQGGVFAACGAPLGGEEWYTYWRDTNPVAASRVRAVALAGLPGRRDRFRGVRVTENFAPGSRLQLLSNNASGRGTHIPMLLPLGGSSVLGAWQEGSNHGALDTRLVCRRSDDGGRTWGTPVIIPAAPGGGESVRFGQLSRVGDAIWAVYSRCVGTTDGGRLRRRVSTDGGRTWGPEEALAGLPDDALRQALSFSPLLRLASGRLLLPIQDYGAGRWISYVAMSDDNGANWRPVRLADATTALTEGSIVVGADGATLYLWLRAAGGGVCWRSKSTDEGRTWTAPEPTGIPNPDSRTVARRLADGRTLLVGNDAASGRRRGTVWAVSGDDAAMVSARWQFADYGEFNNNSNRIQYPDALVSGGELHLLYAQEGPQGHSQIQYRRATAEVAGLAGATTAP